MTAEELFRGLVEGQKTGAPRGIPSVCSAHPVVLEAAFHQAERDGLPVLIESTVNQVNHLGGYTGMTPEGFRALVWSIADARGFPRERIILGGDHLGPYPWRSQRRDAAMGNSRALVEATVSAGYAKVHLDASMPLADDVTDGHGALDPRTVAAREADLAAVAEAAFEKLRSVRTEAPAPVYVIGTEVPTPGGSRAAESSVAVTRAEDLRSTVSLCREAFHERGLDQAWSRVFAVVAQPGVEYGDQEIHPYDRGSAEELCAAARELPGIVLEGHSTDYQSPRHLRELVEDGVAVLKVGPALTFALRECLFSLEHIEREMLKDKAGAGASDLSDVLERAMIADPSHWSGYYSGTEEQKHLARKYSFSDRSRYYWSVPTVRSAVEVLLGNLRRTGIPLNLLSQYLPLQAVAAQEGRCAVEPAELTRESVRLVLERYSRAVRTETPA